MYIYINIPIHKTLYNNVHNFYKSINIYLRRKQSNILLYIHVEIKQFFIHFWLNDTTNLPTSVFDFFFTKTYSKLHQEKSVFIPILYDLLQETDCLASQHKTTSHTSFFHRGEKTMIFTVYYFRTFLHSFGFLI